jgi:cyclopropane-fatty-acyl-phospholipid synthase
MLLAKGLNKIVKIGALRIIDANGKTHEIVGSDGPKCTVRLHDRALHFSLLADPFLKVGESYMDGTLTIEEGTLGDLLDFLCLSAHASEDMLFFRLSEWLGRRMRWLQQRNPVARAKKNVAHHYDLSSTLYDLFLDADRQYSCAYFLRDDDSLETAQENKKRHIAAKLLLEPGQRVLDIGSGWGGLGLYLADVENVDVTGVTLSEEQYDLSQQRVAGAGLQDRVRFKLEDYRLQTGKYDRIVSVGMFEHIGAGHFREFFAKLRELLTDDGLALLHSIGRMEPPGATNAWLRKYIFPGGYSPSLSEVIAALEKEKLYITDIEILRLHYAKTLEHWHDRFQKNRVKIAEIYDERFCRMWEFYFMGCMSAFKYWDQMVFQMQISRRQDAVPLSRDYITEWERGQARRQAKRPVIAA